VEIHYATKRAFAGLLAANPHVDRIHSLDDNWAEFVRSLRAEGFDRIVDLHSNLRSMRIRAALRIPAKGFPKDNLAKWWLVRSKQDRMSGRHVVDRYFDTLLPLGIRYDGAGLEHHIPPEAVIGMDERPEAFRSRFVAVALGARHATKMLPEQQLAALLSQIKSPVTLLGGPGDRPLGDRLAAADPDRIWNAAGAFDLNGSASILRDATCLLSPDTGLMHLAAAFDLPIWSFWGSTVPAFGMTPSFPDRSSSASHSQIAEVENLDCRPCSKLGYPQCPRGHFRCMQDQDMQAAANWANLRSAEAVQ
jgi:ADP-heptose:LPS heptosyltransferase